LIGEWLETRSKRWQTSRLTRLSLFEKAIVSGDGMTRALLEEGDEKIWADGSDA
jgi:hypothetical protein